MKQNKINQLVLNHSLSNPLLGDLMYGDLQEVDLEVHSDEKTWLYLEGSRSDADRILADRPDGTFLVRTSRTGQYALSIMYVTLATICGKLPFAVVSMSNKLR